MEGHPTVISTMLRVFRAQRQKPSLRKSGIKANVLIFVSQIIIV